MEAHVSNDQGMDDEEYITQLIHACPFKQQAGRSLRWLQNKGPYYRALKDAGDHASCKALVLAELRSLQRSKFSLDIDANKADAALRFSAGDDVEDYQMDWKDVMELLRQQGVHKDERTLVHDYEQKMSTKDCVSDVLDSIPKTLAKHMDLA